MAYIDSISQQGKKYGMCKVVPPEGWHMPFRLETETFRFKARLQRLNQLEAASRAKLNFLEQLSMYHMQQGDSKIHIPLIDRQPLDLWKLRREVNRSGGNLELDRTKGWSKITEVLGHKPSWTPHVRAAYMNIVLPFDNWAVRAKSASVSPLAKLNPGSSSSPSKPPPVFVSDTFSASPIKPGQGISRTSTASRRPTVKMRPNCMHFVSPPDKGRPPSKRASVNGDSVLADAIEVNQPGSLSTAPSATASTPTTLRINVPGFSDREGSDSELSDEDSVLSSPSIRKAPFEPEYQKGEVCEICKGEHDPGKILLCDGCDRGFHIYCLDPPLASVPTNEEWYCTSCLLSQGEDFGFEEGDEHSVASFQARDAAFSHAWWNRHNPHNSPRASVNGAQPTNNDDRERMKPRQFGKVTVSEDDVEREFWRLTESSLDTVDVEYGADIHSTSHGSAGPTPETHPLDPYSRDPWNLNNMPILPDSLLRYIKSDISGMTVPWIYIGMMFSAFCWHNEDHYTYSINYMYWGETKTWYGIPGSDAEKFEAAIKSEAPDLFEQQPGLLFQLITMMNPGRLSDAGVKVVACDQRPNEFVITFPKAYHCGFNHGINMNEAVNFALPDWLPDGKDSVRRYREHNKAPVFSHNELLITITLFSETIRTALWLKDALIEMVEEESARREALRAKYPKLVEDLIEEDCPEDQYQCAICKAFCYLAQVTCSCTSQVSCLSHADRLCTCGKPRKVLRMRYSEAQLEDIRDVVVHRAALPEQWHVRFFSLMESPRPQLKSMRTLVLEGERIAHPIPDLGPLKRFVDVATSLIQQIMAITTRKSVGRRKKASRGDGNRKGKRTRAERDDEEDDGIDRSPGVLSDLLKQADRLAFDAPELPQLRQLMLAIEGFRTEASSLLTTPEDRVDRQRCKNALILGQSFGLNFPELSPLEKLVQRQEWFRQLEEEVDDANMEYDDVVAFLEESLECQIPRDHAMVKELSVRERKGKRWIESVEKLLASSQITLGGISSLIEARQHVPVSTDVLRKLESLRKSAISWQTSARNALATHGSPVAASRLCKNVAAASKPLSNVVIPEIRQLQAELKHHALWREEACKVLGVPVARLASTIDYIRSEFENSLAPDDDAYNDQRRLPNDDGPSLDAFIGLISPQRWNFLINPSEFEPAQYIASAAMRYAPQALRLADPFSLSHPCRDLDLLRHTIRKIYTLPLVFDAYNSQTNERCVFVNWLFRRMQDVVRTKTKQISVLDRRSLTLPAGQFTSANSENGTPSRRAKPRRRARIILAESHPHEFYCLCGMSPAGENTAAQVECPKCGQGYHAICVQVAEELAGKSVWRCPCCTVRDGRHYQKDVEVRVQLRSHRGTDQFLDYRTIINDFAEHLVVVTRPTSANAITLECIDFVPAHIPDNVKTMEGGGSSLNRIKKRKSTIVDGVFRNEQTASNSVAHNLIAATAKCSMDTSSTILSEIPTQITSSGTNGSSVAMSTLSGIQAKSDAVSRSIYTSDESNTNTSVLVLAPTIQNRSTFDMHSNVSPRSCFTSTPVATRASTTSVIGESSVVPSATTMCGGGREAAVIRKSIHDDSINSHRGSEERNSCPDMGESIAVEEAVTFGRHVVDEDVIMENQ
ncbi:histone demethylase JARID1 [Cryptococcus deuterogattii 2001/935-1]|nr:histone demethylase JARID1 [Cryptococcus deuterogattii 2001/935-1]